MIVETSGGRVRGSSGDGVRAFKGIAYAEAERFGPPRRAIWAGVREANAFGPRAPQSERPSEAPYRAWLADSTPTGEDCLVLNVWTADAAGCRPVMVYLHGGGFATGSGAGAGIDGANLAHGGVVLVTVNHRLNLFGHLHLGDSERFAHAGNAGLLDLVAALEWVRDNIALFGGDPRNVTIFGQSGGGSKVAALMAMPRAHGLFHKAIIQSASSLLALATPEEAERNTHHLLGVLGADRPEALVSLPTRTLLAAMPAAIRAAGRIDDFRPVVDGHTLPSQPFDPCAVALSKDVPLLTGWCADEQRLTFAATPEVYRRSEAQARADVALALGIGEDAAADLIAVYREARPADAPGEHYTRIFGDHRYRRSVTRAAELQCAHAGAPVHLYRLDWQTPVMDGLLRAPHTLCIPFVFGNVKRAAGITGEGDDRIPLQERMVAAWVAFATRGDPNHAGLSAWPPFSLGERATLLFDREDRVVFDPLAAERIALERHPRYVPSVGEGRLR